MFGGDHSCYYYDSVLCGEGGMMLFHVPIGICVMYGAGGIEIWCI